MCAHCTKKDTLDRSPTIFLEKQIRPPTLMLMVHDIITVPGSQY